MLGLCTIILQSTRQTIFHNSMEKRKHFESSNAECRCVHRMWMISGWEILVQTQTQTSFSLSSSSSPPNPASSIRLAEFRCISLFLHSHPPQINVDRYNNNSSRRPKTEVHIYHFTHTQQRMDAWSFYLFKISRCTRWCVSGGFLVCVRCTNATDYDGLSLSSMSKWLSIAYSVYIRITTEPTRKGQARL